MSRHAILKIPGLATPANGITVVDPRPAYENPADIWGHWVLDSNSMAGMTGLANGRDLTGNAQWESDHAVVGDGRRLGTGFTASGPWAMFVVGYYTTAEDRQFIGSYTGSPSNGVSLYGATGTTGITISHTRDPAGGVNPSQGLSAADQWFCAIFSQNNSGASDMVLSVPTTTDVTEPHPSTYVPADFDTGEIIVGGLQDNFHAGTAQVAACGIWNKALSTPEMATAYGVIQANMALKSITV